MRPLHGNPEAITAFRDVLNAPLPGTQEAKREYERQLLAQQGLTPEMVQEMMRKRQSGE